MEGYFKILTRTMLTKSPEQCVAYLAYLQVVGAQPVAINIFGLVADRVCQFVADQSTLRTSMGDLP